MAFQTLYTADQPVARIGQVNALVRSVTKSNNALETAQVSRGVFGTTLGWTTGATITAGGFAFTQVGSAAGETALTFAQNAANTINGSIAFDRVFASAVGNGTNAATLTVTARQNGALGSFDFSVVPNVANAAGTIAGTAANSSAPIQLGVVAGRLYTDGDDTFRAYAGTTTGRVLGGVAAHIAQEQIGLGQFAQDSDPFDGIPRFGNAEIVAQGDMWLRSDAAMVAGTGVYVRIATTAGFTNVGYLTTNTVGAELVSGIQANAASITLESGEIATLVSINLPQ